MSAVDARSFYRLAGEHCEALIVRTPAGLVAVPTRDDVIGERTFVDGAFEAQTTAAALALLRREARGDLAGRDVLEVGANIGTQSLAFVRDLGARRVIALEPAPATAALLRATIAANALGDRIEVVMAAASDVDGVVAMELNPSNCGDYRVRTGDAGGGMGEQAWETVAVPARRLDDLVRDGTVDVTALGLVWMDAQGHEGQILAGASRILDAGVATVSEFWPYGLRRAQGFDTFCDIVASRYRRAFDLRAGSDGVAREIDPRDLRSLAREYEPPSVASVDVGFTDLVLLP
ncbi:MAG: hypothetical protein QOI73_2981 [Solirubrobacteraceae bacterium]|nr:hypothetical protein [Solirubrobacteraceae bacterium]